MKQGSTYQRFFLSTTVMLVTIIEVLDMTIVNVALPSMMGSLGASSEEITWILTSYIVSAAIFMPMTGLLIETLGQKKLLLLNIVGFLFASMLCGIATSLNQMVVFRIAQGVFGASLVPLSQFILRNAYAAHEQGKAMAIWGMGVMTAPVLGPTLGGYITEWLNWRWVFFINLPVCLLAFVLCLKFIEETETFKKAIDWWGMTLMALGIGAFQIFLDQGNSQDWFNSDLITFLFILAILSLGSFIYHSIHTKHPLIDLRLFTNKNFCTAIVLLLGYMVALFGVISTQPMMLEKLMSYPTETTGLLMAPRGIASAITMAFISRIINRINPKYLLATGLALSFFSTHWMSQFQLHTPEHTIIWTGIIQGIGMGLFFVPLSTLAFATLLPIQTGTASGIFSLGRSLGSSIGISFTSTLISRQTQIAWHDLSEKVTQANSALQQFLYHQQLTVDNPTVLALLSHHILQRATFIAYVDGYLLGSYLFLLFMPLIVLLDTPKIGKNGTSLASH